MSMNIYIRASREVRVVSTGKLAVQNIGFSAWQTPTTITQDIVISNYPASVYKAWVLSQGEDQVVQVFAEDDPWEERDPIGTEIYNVGKEHVARFEEWLEMCSQEGYEVHYEMF
jgi:hypothetical protein